MKPSTTPVIPDSMYNPMDRHGYTTFADAWFKFPASFVQSAAAANKAALSAFVDEREKNGDDELVSVDGDEQLPGVPSVAYEELDWEFERSVEDWQEISVGDTVTFAKTLTDEDVQAFAHISGDTNRLHLDDEFAEGTRFGGRIAHGTLVSGLISSALARLPGLTIYLSQDLEFRHPVRIGDHVSAHVEVIEDLGDNQFCLSTVIHDDDEQKTIIDGEAVVLIDEPPEA